MLSLSCHVSPDLWLVTFGQFPGKPTLAFNDLFQTGAQCTMYFHRKVYKIYNKHQFIRKLYDDFLLRMCRISLVGVGVREKKFYKCFVNKYWRNMSFCRQIFTSCIQRSNKHVNPKFLSLHLSTSINAATVIVSYLSRALHPIKNKFKSLYL